jgi:hypothetical protein
MLKQLSAAAVAVFMVFAGATALAHKGHVHPVRGTVVMAAADHVMMKTTDGKDVTFKVTEKTKVTSGKQAMKVEELQPGARIVVTGVSEKDPLTAATIQTGTGKTAAAKTAGKKP